MLKSNSYVTPVQEEPPQLKRHREHRHVVWLLPDSLAILRNPKNLTVSERKFAGHVLDTLQVLPKAFPLYEGKVPKVLIRQLVANIIKRENLLPLNKVPGDGVSSAMNRWVKEGWLGQAVLKKKK